MPFINGDGGFWKGGILHTFRPPFAGREDPDPVPQYLVLSRMLQASGNS